MKKNISGFTLFIIIALFIPNQTFAKTTDTKKINTEKTNLCQQNCTLVILSDVDNKFTVINKNRANQQFSPFSTFKIANSLIALDLGVVNNLKQQLTFDQKKYPVQKWWPKRWYKTPLTLYKAFKYSAVPIYQQIASIIGATKMQNYVDKFNYGNRDITPNIDSFWLNEALKISATEQVLFLQKTYHQQLGLKEKTYQQLNNIMLLEQSNSNINYKIYAKTGTGHINKTEVLGWYVGYVKNDQGVYYFALNMSANKFSGVTKPRINITKHYLQQLGII